MLRIQVPVALVVTERFQSGAVGDFNRQVQSNLDSSKARDTIVDHPTENMRVILVPHIESNAFRDPVRAETCVYIKQDMKRYVIIEELLTSRKMRHTITETVRRVVRGIVYRKKSTK